MSPTGTPLLLRNLYTNINNLYHTQHLPDQQYYCLNGSIILGVTATGVRTHSAPHTSFHSFTIVFSCVYNLRTMRNAQQSPYPAGCFFLILPCHAMYVPLE